jgi:hypothetical protein
MLQSEIRRENGLSTIYVDGKVVAPMTFCSRHIDDAGYVRRLRKAGIRMWWPFCDTDWQRRGAFEDLRAQCAIVMKEDSEAILMIRVSLNPPARWLLENPHERVLFENGAHHLYDPDNPQYRGDSLVREAYNGIGDYSLASDVWARDACTAMGAFMDRIEASAFGHRVAGYFLNAGGTEEWYYGATHDRRRHCIGFEPAFRRAFEAFLRRKYASLDGLRAAWRDATATFEDPRIPPLEERRLSRSRTEYEVQRMRHVADFGSFLDPARSQPLIDFYEAWNDATGRSLLTIAGFIKERTARRALVGAFYGCQGCVLYHDFGTSKTSLALNSPDVDFLSAPTNYEDRVIGGGAGFTNPIDSMHLRGKCWINEDDNGTSLQERGRWATCLQTRGIGEDVQIMKRDFARNLCEDAYAWWFENSGTDKWWDHPELLAAVSRMQAIMAEYYRGGRSKHSGIACLYDESSLWCTDNETCKDAFQFNRILELPRIGAPVDHYFLDDLLLPDFPARNYKVILIFNAASIDDVHRQAIARTLMRDGKTVIWVYAGGFINPDRSPALDMAHARELTGIDLQAREGAFDLTWLREKTAHPFLEGMPDNETWGRYRRPLANGLGWRLGRMHVLAASLGQPLFTCAEPAGPGTVVLGRFTANGWPAVVARDRGSWTSVFLGSKVVPAELIRAIAAASGVHVYGTDNDVVYANHDFLGIHTAEEGKRTLLLPRQAMRVTEVFDGEVVARDCDRFTVDLPFGVTKLYRLQWAP